MVDNADDVRLLAAAGDRVADGTGWIRRPSPWGRLVVTSRNQSRSTWGDLVQLHPLCELATEHAAQMLRDRAGDAAGTLEQAAALAVRLGCTPLMLHQAGLYLAQVRHSAPWPGVRRNPRTFEEYRSALDDRFGELVDGPTGHDPAPQPRLCVTATWELTLDLLADQGMAVARPLMRLLAHFADAPIPYAMVLSPTSLAASPLFVLRNENDLERAIDALADFGLLIKQTPDIATDDPVAYTVTLHPVIGETIRALDAVRAHRHEYLALAAEQLGNAVQDRDTRDPTSRPFWQLTASHVHRLCALVTTTGEAVPTALVEVLTMTAAACTSSAISAGLYTQAEATITHVIVVTTDLQPDQAAVLTLRHQTARLKDHYGDLAGAEVEFRAVLTDWIRVLGAEHPDTVWARYSLAGVQAERGDLAGAEVEFRAVLTDWIRVLGAEHPDTVWARYSLAGVQAERGDLAGAEAEFRAVLTDWIRVLGAEHPDTVWARHSLAGVQAERGDLAGAEAEYRAVLSDRTRVLGAEHPDTLWARHSLAGVQAQRGDLAGAEVEYWAVLSDRTRVLGAEHPDTVWARHNLAGVQAQRGDLAGAEAEYWAVLSDRTRVLGADHPDTLATKDALLALRDRRR